MSRPRICGMELLAGDGVNPILIPPGRSERRGHRWEATDNLSVVILIRGMVISIHRRGGCD